MNTIPASLSTRDAERLQHVGAPALRRVGSVAVLGDPHAGARGDERRDGGNIERAHRPAPGARGIDEFIRALGGQPDHSAPECANDAGQLGSRLAARAQS
jgi:hypothetical protein